MKIDLGLPQDCRFFEMNSNVVVIDHRKVGLHEAFVRYAPKVFPSISFERWLQLGGWIDGYRAFSIVEGDEIVASASLQRMQMIVRGKEITGWQLSAVGVLPEHRGRGLQRPIMDRLLASVGRDDFVFLFANEDVLDFYPQFGFRRATEWIFGAEHSIVPQRSQLRRLSIDSSDDRALFQRVASTAAPVTMRFGAKDYGGVVLWYWANQFYTGIYYHEADDAIVIAEEDEEVLRVCDVFATTRIDLAAYLPQLATHPTDHIEFGFTPELYWPQARALFEHLEAPLFVHGNAQLPSGAFKFPMLAQT